MFNDNNGTDFSGGWWMILIFIILFGFGGWNQRGTNTTQSGISDGYILTSDFANIERKIDGVNNGLCDGFYAMNTSLLNGFAGVDKAITQQTITQMQDTNAVTAQINALANQMQSCCCNMQNQNNTNFAQLNYNLAEQSCQTRQAIKDSTAEILGYLTQDKINALTAENTALKFAADQAAQSAYLISQLKA